MYRPDHHERMASVRLQVAAGGLTFEAYLPPALAAWVLRLVEQEVFPYSQKTYAASHV
jgi:hypothetical protein